MLRLLLFIFFGLVSNFLFSQPEIKANKLLRKGNYSAALVAYEKAIKKGNNSTAILSNYAKCLVKLNKVEKSNAILQELYNTKGLNVSALKTFGINKIAIGDYESGKKILNEYLVQREDEEVSTILKNLNKAANIKPHFPNAKIQKFPHNTEYDENSPFILDGKLIFSSDRKNTSNLSKNPTTNKRDFINLYESKISGSEFSEPIALPNKINRPYKNVSNLTSGNGITIVSRNSSIASKSGKLNVLLYELKGKMAKMLPFCNLESNYYHPCLSADGKYLFFVSRKNGNTDLYYSIRTDNKWSSPIRMHNSINTKLNEAYPYLDENYNLYFSSKGHLSYGGFDIFKSTFNGTYWEKPINLGKPLNSSADDISFTQSGDLVMFSSSRDNNNDDLYYFKKNELEAPSHIGSPSGPFYENVDKFKSEAEPKQSSKSRTKNSDIKFKYFSGQ